MAKGSSATNILRVCTGKPVMSVHQCIEDHGCCIILLAVRRSSGCLCPLGSTGLPVRVSLTPKNRVSVILE